MGVVVRQSFITSALSYVGAIIGYFNVLWLFPKLLDREEIGLLRTLIDAAMLLVPLAQFGISSSVVRFFPHFKHDNDEKRTFLSNLITLSLIGYVFFGAAFLIFEDEIASLFTKNSPKIVPYFKIVLAITLILATTAILEAYSRSLLKVVIPNFIKEILVRVFTSVAVFFYGFEYLNIHQLMNCMVIVYGLSLLALAAYLYYLKQLNFKINFNIFKHTTRVNILKFSLFSVLSGSAGLIVMKVDSLMVSVMIGLDENAIYTMAFFMAVVIEMPRRAISQVMSPLLAYNFKHNKLGETKSLYRKASINQLAIGLLLFIGIIANLDNLYYLIPKWRLFQEGKIVVFIIGIGKLIDMTAGVNSEIIAMSKYYRFNIIAVGVMAVLTILGNYILIPILGLKGAALGSAISIVVFNLIKLIFIRQKFRIQPFSINTIKAILIGLLAFYLSTLIPKLNDIFLDLLIRSVFITIVYGTLILKFRVSNEVNRFYEDIKKTIL